MSFQSFEMQILAYPKHSGIQKLTGLHAIDVNTNLDINLGVLGEFFVVRRVDNLK